MEYFDHNVNASDDDGILALRMEFGGAAVDCYWAIIEKIYRDEAPVVVDENRAETKPLTLRLCVGFSELKNYVSEMVSLGLLKTVGNDPFTVSSERAERTIERVRERCETARQNGKLGGRPKGSKTQRKPNGNPTETQRKPIKIKEEYIETHKGFLYTNDADGASAGEAPAPPSSCPRCDAPLEKTGMRVPGTDRAIWRCVLCGEEVSA